MSATEWDVRFLKLAQEVASWSKDPSTKVGSVIVNAQRQILSLGYNGFPRGVIDDNRLEDRLTKYAMVVHAEANAIVNSTGSLVDSTAYTWPLMPCSTCAGLLIQSGVKRIVSVINDNPRWMDSFNITRNMLKEAEVELHLYDSNCLSFPPTLGRA